MTHDEAVAKARADMAAAAKKLAVQNAVKAEAEYAAAYQRLVALGAAPQLRRKYRRG